MEELLALLGIKIILDPTTTEVVKNIIFGVLGNGAYDWLRALFRREDKPVHAFEKACKELGLAQNRVAKKKLENLLDDQTLKDELESVHRVTPALLEKWFSKLGITSKHLPEFLYILYREMIEDEHRAQLIVFSAINKALLDSILAGQVKIKEDIVQYFKTRFDELTQIVSALPLPSRVSLIGQSYLPYRPNPFFKGREQELKIIHEMLSTGPANISQIVAAAGLGGIGKTELAVNYAHRYRDFYPDGIFWVNAEGDDLSLEFLKLAPYLVSNLADDMPDEEILTQVKLALNFRAKRLLILDNVTSAKAITAYLPVASSGTHVLITSRLQDIGVEVKSLSIDVLPSEAALQLLLSRRQNEKDLASAQRICQLLGNLPLALELAAGYLGKKPNKSLAEYLSDLEQTGALKHKTLCGKYIRGRLSTQHETNIAATFEISYRLIELNPPAKTAFFAASWFAPFSISEEMLTATVNDEDAIEELVNLSLLKREQDMRLFMHRLVREFAQEIQEQQIRQQMQLIVVDNLINLCQIGGSVRSEDILKEIDHIEYGLTILSNQEHQKRMVLQHWLGKTYTLLGRSEYAINVLNQSLELAEKLHNRRFQAIVLTSLGKALQRQGNFKLAEEVLLQSLTLEKDFSNPRSLAIVLNSLGAVLQRQKKLAEAEIILRQCLELDKKSNNKRHEAIVLNSLGTVLKRQGKLSEAETVSRQSLQLAREFDDRYSQAIIQNSLGIILLEQGKFSEAEELLYESLKIDEETKNKHHQAIVLNSLGRVFQRQGKFSEAEKALRQALELTKELDYHSQQLVILNFLGRAFQKQGKLGEAEKVLLQGLELAKALGDHRHQLTMLNFLIRIFLRQGKLRETEKVLLRVLELTKESSYHHKKLKSELQYVRNRLQAKQALPEYIEKFAKELEKTKGLERAKRLHRMGKLLESQNHFDEAIAKLEESLEIGKELNKYQHLAMVFNSLGSLLRKLGRFREAEEVLMRGLHITELLTSKEEYSAALNSLGIVLSMQEKYQDAHKIFLQSLEIASMIKNRKQRAITLHLFALSQVEERKFLEAEKSLTESLAIGQELGDNFHQALVLNTLARALSGLQKYAEALAALHQSLVLGEDLGEDEAHLTAVHHTVGKVWQEQQHLVDAEQAFRQSLSIAERLADLRQQGHVYRSLAMLEQAKGNVNDAINNHEKSLHLLKTFWNRPHPEIADGLMALGALMIERSDFARALNLYREAEEIVKTLQLSELTRYRDLSQICKQLEGRMF
jgi:tetratricopeptide (TPR) repeat protein